jgi:hypothetical protein
MSEIEKETSLVEVATIVSDALQTWFANERIPNPEFERFRSASRST